MTAQTISTFTTSSIIFLLTLVFGVWLGLSGKPYNGLLFNVHKLIALCAVIITVMQFYQAFTTVDIQANQTALILVAALSALALFATGALMSLGKLPYRLLRAIHSVSSILATLALAGIFTFLFP